VKVTQISWVQATRFAGAGCLLTIWSIVVMLTQNVAESEDASYGTFTTAVLTHTPIFSGLVLPGR